MKTTGWDNCESREIFVVKIASCYPIQIWGLMRPERVTSKIKEIIVCILFSPKLKEECEATWSPDVYHTLSILKIPQCTIFCSYNCPTYPTRWPQVRCPVWPQHIPLPYPWHRTLPDSRVITLQKHIVPCQSLVLDMYTKRCCVVVVFSDSDTTLKS